MSTLRILPPRSDDDGAWLTAVHARAIDEARKQKPSIPLVGYYDIPIHDELELSKAL